MFWLLILCLLSPAASAQQEDHLTEEEIRSIPDSAYSYSMELQRRLAEKRKKEKEQSQVLFQFTASELRNMHLPKDWMFQPPFNLHINNPFPSWMGYPCDWNPDPATCSLESRHLPQPMVSRLSGRGASFDGFLRARAAELAIERVVEEYVSINLETARLYYLYKKKNVDPNTFDWKITPPTAFQLMYEEELENLRNFQAELARKYPDNDEVQQREIKTSPPSPGFLREKLNRIPPTREVSIPPILKELAHESLEARCFVKIDEDRFVKLFIERTFDQRPLDHPLCSRAYKKDATACYTYIYNVYAELADLFKQDGQLRVQQTSGSVFTYVSDETIVNKIHNDFSYAKDKVAYQISSEASFVSYSLPAGRSYALRTPIRRVAQSTVISMSKEGDFRLGDPWILEPAEGATIDLRGSFTLIGRTYINLPETVHLDSISFGQEKIDNIDLQCKTFFNDTRV